MKVDLSEIEAESSGSYDPKRSMQISKHFGIFRDLFHPDAYFYPVVPLRIEYECERHEEAGEEDTVSCVCCGNILRPAEVSEQPTVSYEAPDDSYWTLVMLNADGNPYEENREVLQWMVTNIKGNRVSEGDVICDYLPPLPFYGSGYHRVVFVLFHHDSGKTLDFSRFRKKLPCNNLEERAFCMPYFYKEYEDEITPAGLAFFQSEWDSSTQHCLHNRLGLEQPLYKYDWPKPGRPEQEEFPSEEQSFNQYLDLFRDSKDVQRELLVKRLRNRSPFEGEPEKLKYPNIFFYDDKHSMSSWEHTEKQKERLAMARYRDLYENRID